MHNYSLYNAIGFGCIIQDNRSLLYPWIFTALLASLNFNLSHKLSKIFRVKYTWLYEENKNLSYYLGYHIPSIYIYIYIYIYTYNNYNNIYT
jgi:hypothetical protein